MSYLAFGLYSGCIQLPLKWQALIGSNGIESKSDLARYLGISRARITHVLSRLPG